MERFIFQAAKDIVSRPYGFAISHTRGVDKTGGHRLPRWGTRKYATLHARQVAITCDRKAEFFLPTREVILKTQAAILDKLELETRFVGLDGARVECTLCCYEKSPLLISGRGKTASGTPPEGRAYAKG